MVRVKVEVSIDHTDIVPLSSIDNDPSQAIAKLVRRFVESGSPRSMSEDIGEHTPNEGGDWDIGDFNTLIKELVDGMKNGRTDIDDLLSLLIAYGKGSSNRPTSDDLKSRSTTGPIDQEVWNQHLRKSKARLTISARNMTLPDPFGSPYGKTPKRKHPIKKELHSHLVAWVAGQNDSCLLNVDGAGHEDSIADLRVPSSFRAMLG